MTENIKCPCCGSEKIQTFLEERVRIRVCNACNCHWNESQRQPPNTVPTGDKAECLNLYEEAVDLIDSLNSEQRIDYSDYSLLRDAVDAIGNCIEENIQPPNAWIACSERLPKGSEWVLLCFNNTVGMGYYDPEYGLWWIANLNDLTRTGVTHWQSRPQPPVTRKAGE